MSIATRLFTAEDLWQMPNDGNCYELIKGELRTMPPSGFEHGAVGINLALPLAQHIKAHKLGVVVGAETGFLIARKPDTVRGVDIGFVRQDRVDATGMLRTYWPGVPDLAVEVVSPNDKVFEVDEKVEEWLGAGTQMVWVVNPRRRTITVYRPSSTPVVLTVKDTLDGQEVVSGFSFPVANVFP